MSAQTEAVNEVRLQGRLSKDPEERRLPSGDTLRVFRVVIDRPQGRAQGRRQVDALECVAWTARTRRTVATWGAGDLVEVGGSLRRRFFRTPGGAASMVEVEVRTARRVRRAAS